MTSRDPTLRVASPSTYCSSRCPGSSWHRRTTVATRRSCSTTSCGVPDFPRKRKRISAPETSACRVRSVVSPNDSPERTYSSLPTRIRVSSSSRTTAATTRSGPRRGERRSASTCRRSATSARPNPASSSNLATSRCRRHRGWYRYCLRPLASRPVAWRCPAGSAQIHTSVHAGGTASARTRASVSLSVIRAPRWSAYENPVPLRRRRMPGSASPLWRRPLSGWARRPRCPPGRTRGRARRRGRRSRRCRRARPRPGRAPGGRRRHASPRPRSRPGRCGRP